MNHAQNSATLTIAQSSPIFSDTQSDTAKVWPCGVRLYCGYAYESSLIASTAKTMLPAALLFSLELLLLSAFILNASAGNFSLRIPVVALAILFQICSILSSADFFFKYSGLLSIDPVWLCFHLSVGALLLFLALHAEHLRPLFWSCTVLQWCATLIFFVAQAGSLVKYGDLYAFFVRLPQLVEFFTLLATLIGSFFLWKQGSRFFRHLTQTALILIIGYTLFLIISISFSPSYVSRVITRLWGDLTQYTPNASLKLIWNVCLISILVSVAIEVVEQAMERRTEHTILAIKNELAMESYENLRQQSEEVMMLRHDTMKHYSLLRIMAAEAPERLTGYLDELIGQVNDVRPVVASRNQILNILINGKLNSAAQMGISTEIVRSDTPEKLPLTDAELCCLVVNILDNAINAASGSTTGVPYIRLDFHCKDQHFVFPAKILYRIQMTAIKKHPRQSMGMV